jgi:heme-degrading monooxygenase HmoA
MWTGYAATDRSDGYPKHLLQTVRPKLAAVSGFRGFYLLRRESPDEVEYQVLTLWDSMDALRGFTGDYPERAVVEPAARAVLRRYDNEVRHYEVLAGHAEGPADG